MADSKVDIRPGISILGVLKHLNYKPWYALGEFVDNSLQSYLKYTSSCNVITPPLEVSINIDSSIPACISIRDNAYGIELKDFSRAFKTASIPPDNSGLSEFGMGMKSAACWFSPRWSVRTSAINDNKSRKVTFVLEDIIDEDLSQVDIIEDNESASVHYTEVVLNEIFHMPVKKTLYKIKSHLSSIYRDFIRSGKLILKFNNEVLSYSEPEVLHTPYFKDVKGPVVKWKKNIDFSFGNGIRVTGFAGIRALGNTSQAGFSLFRRGRVIQGSSDEGYRPSFIFGSSNSFKYQRLFGELHLDGIEVSHTKDGFRWGEYEQDFLNILRDELDSDDMPLLKQSEGYRSRTPVEILEGMAESAINSSADSLLNNLPGIIPNILGAELVDAPPELIVNGLQLANREFDISFRYQKWLIDMQIINDASESQWLILSDSGNIGELNRKIIIRLNVAHPFMTHFINSNNNMVEALLRVAAALSVAEVVARDSGVRKAGTIRRNFNEILRDALSDFN